MVRGSVRKSVDRPKYRAYLQVADDFRHAADVAREYEYWNASGLLIVHAAIAYADALGVSIGGVKCQGEDHHEVIALLQELTAGTDAQKKALSHLARIIDHKTAVAYSGDIYSERDIDQLRKHLDRFESWVVSLLKK